MAELGETNDPRALIPGDAAAIDDNVLAIRGRGQTMERAGVNLRNIDSGAWSGQAAEQFRDKFSYEPARWHNAGDSFDSTATTLDDYADTLRWAQRQASEAIHLWAEAQAATERAHAEHDAAVDEANRQNQANAAAGDSAQVQPPAFDDPGEEKRQAARDLLNRARQQLTDVGDRAAAVIRGDGDQAPEESLWDELGDAASAVGDFVVGVGEGLWEGFTGTLDFLWQLSPTHLIDNPDHYAELWDGVTQAASFAAEHPVEFGKKMISWDQWSKEPGRALGNTLFGFIPGLGVLSKVKKFKKLDELADDAPSPDAPPVKASVGDYFTGGSPPTASDLARYAEAQGWAKTQTETGPAKYVDENGVARMTLKEGSPRAPGSDFPHVELKDENGQRIDSQGNPVTRKSPGNHTPIEWDQ